MLLDRFLRDRDVAELKEFFSFWDGDAAAPENPDALIGVLQERMTDEELIRKRLRFLSKKLIDVLRYLLRCDAFRAGLSQILGSRVFSYMSQYEVTAALNALQKRGFVFCTAERAQRMNGNSAFAVPLELGEILGSFLLEADHDLKNSLTLMGFLKHQTNGAVPESVLKEAPAAANPEAVHRALMSPAEVRHRVGGLPEPLRALFECAVTKYGGFLPKSQHDRQKHLPRWDRRSVKEAFEKAYLGTVRHFVLGEYGINHFDDTLVIFGEIVEAVLGDRTPPSEGAIDSVKSLGVDLVSDISSYLSLVGHDRIRLTLNGQIHRSAVKKLADDFILGRKAEFDGEEIFQYVHAFCLAQKLVQRKGERQLGITVKGRTWESMPLGRKLKLLIRHAMDEHDPADDQFHVPKLRRIALEVMKNTELDRWYDVWYLPWVARNRYLVSLDAEGVRDAFQNRYQYSASAAMRDPLQLGQSIYNWLRGRLFLIGSVDLAYCQGKPAQVRLSLLGAKALDRSETDTAAVAQKPLVVNPDFEVIVFPEGDTYDLICGLDRFCVRTKSDNAHHFRIEPASVKKAAAENLTAAEMLALLSEHSRTVIPQNVIYSIREWAEKVKFVSLQRGMLLRGHNKEVIDRIVHEASLRALVAERLSPTVLLVSDGAPHEELERGLQAMGIFLDREGQVRDGSGSSERL